MARDYGRILTAFWNHPKTRACSDQGKLLGTYLLTGPHSNAAGAYLLPDAYIADDLGWTQETVSKALAELFAKGFAQRFKDGRHIVVCDFLDWNPIENPNVGKAVLKQLDQVPDDPALEHAFNGLQQYAQHFPNGFGTLSKRYAKPFRNIEPEPNLTEIEPEPEPEPRTREPQAVAPPSKPKRVGRTSLPEGFPTEDEMSDALVFWRERGREDIRVYEEAAKFRDHHRAHGKTMADWPAAWRTWFHNTLKFNPKERDNGRNGSAEGKQVRAAASWLSRDAGEAGGTEEEPAGIAGTGAKTLPRSVQSTASEDHDHPAGFSPAFDGFGRHLPGPQQHGRSGADPAPANLLGRPERAVRN